MKFNLSTNPDPIILDVDGDVITIQHERLTATDRVTAMELADDGLAASMEFLFSKFLAWEGVEDESGTPIPLQRSTSGGAIQNNVNRVFGMLPFSVSAEAWVQQMVINGIGFDKVDRFAKGNLNEVRYRQVKEVAERLGKRQPKTASASSTT